MFVKSSVTDIRGSETWGYPHYVDIIIHHFSSQGFKPALESEFGCRISAATGQSPITSYRRDADNSTLSLNDIRKGIFGAINGAEKVNIHNPLDHVHIQVLNQCAHADACVVDEDVDATEGI